MKNLFKVLIAAVSILFLSAFAYGQAATTGTVTTGHQVTFSVTANGTLPFSYQWFKNGTTIAGATAQNYVIGSILVSDAATYTVSVSNTAGSTTSNNAVLTVNQVPVFITQPTSGSISYGASYTFTASVSGIPTPTLQWQLNGVNIAGATSSTLIINNATPTNAGSYTLIASNSTVNGTITTPNAIVSSGATLAVSAAVAPTITNLSVTIQ